MVTKLIHTETCAQELRYIFQIYIKLLTNDNKCRYKIKRAAHTSAYNSMKLKMGKHVLIYLGVKIIYK